MNESTSSVEYLKTVPARHGDVLHLLQWKDKTPGTTVLIIATMVVTLAVLVSVGFE